MTESGFVALTPLVAASTWVPITVVALVLGCVVGWLVGMDMSGDL